MQKTHLIHPTVAGHDTAFDGHAAYLPRLSYLTLPDQRISQ